VLSRISITTTITDLLHETAFMIKYDVTGGQTNLQGYKSNRQHSQA